MLAAGGVGASIQLKGLFSLCSLVPLWFNLFLPLPRWIEHPHGQIGGKKRNLETIIFFSLARA